MQHPSCREGLPPVCQTDKAGVSHAHGLCFSQESLTLLPEYTPCSPLWMLPSVAADGSLAPMTTLHTQQVRGRIQSHAHLYPDTGSEGWQGLRGHKPFPRAANGLSTGVP